MKKTGFLFILLSFGVAFAQPPQLVSGPHTINLTSDTIYWQIPSLDLGSYLLFSKIDSFSWFNNDVEKDQQYNFILTNGSATTKFTTSPSHKVVEEVVFTRDGMSKKMLFVFWPNLSAAAYSDEYKKKMPGSINFEIPEVYELAYTALGLAVADKNGNYPLNRSVDYYNEVQAYFAPYKNHPLIAALKKNISLAGGLSFNSLCMDAYSCTIDSNSQIQYIKPYTLLGSRSVLNENLALWEDFAKKSGFRQFYTAHIPYYNSLIKESETALEFNNAWKWIEQNCPGVKTTSYRFVISPVTPYIYKSKKFQADGFSESLFFANAFISSSYKNVNRKSATLLYLSGFFTAAFKNTYSAEDKENAALAEDVFSDLATWAETGKDAFRLPDAKTLFEEYLAQSAFLIYVKATAGADFRTLKFFRTRFMKQKGFKQFEKFYETLQKIWEKQGDVKNIAACVTPLLHALKT
jgi:hypothetical protein